MDKHQLHGEINFEIERTPQDIVDKLKKHDTCKIGDSMSAQGLMNYQIKSITAGMKIAGPAVTVLTRPGDALYVQKVIEVAKPGDVIVIDAGGVKDVACIGERLSHYMQENGINGVVVDGAIRDSRGIIDLGFPVFSKSICMKLFGSRGPGAINVPIQCGGVSVNPGDMIVGDEDGVVCIPREYASEVLMAANKHLEDELYRLEQFKAGKNMTEIFGLEDKLKEWR
ncbi:RraA family protein [Radiobacillus sp. PE A8.2]|uniref:RraA family protein n=1 Tax=Radiobacillus sp. PE A8.2 TaxID=3380349 RepID=UPI00389060A2